MNEIKICRTKSYIISSVLTIEPEIILPNQVLDVNEINLRYYLKEIMLSVVTSHVHFGKGNAHSKVNLLLLCNF